MCITEFKMLESAILKAIQEVISPAEQNIPVMPANVKYEHNNI